MLKFTFFIFCFIFISVFILFLPTYHSSYSFASTDRQVIFDKEDDNLFINITNNKPFFDKDTNDDAVDIDSVNLFNDGKILEPTIWVGDRLPSNNHLNLHHVNYLIYGMLIDSDFDLLTGKDGVDYQLEIQWNNQTQSWTRFVGEYSSSDSFRTIQTQENYFDFYGDAINSTTKKDIHGYVTLSLDLKDINLPQKFNLMFYSQKEYNREKVVEFDFTNSITIPSPQFSFTPIQNSETVRQGETKSVSTQFKTNLCSLLKSVEFESIQNESGVKLTPKIKKLSDPVLTTQPMTFDISVDDSVNVGPYTIPVLLKTNVEAQGQAAKFLNLHYFDPSFYNSSGYVLSDSNVTITVIPKESLFQVFKEFWDTFGDFISLIGGGFIAGITALVFERVKNRKARDKGQQRLDNIS